MPRTRAEQDLHDAAECVAAVYGLMGGLSDVQADGLGTLSPYILGVPELLRGPIVRYILRGYPPGNFLSAVLSNDLLEAVARSELLTQNSFFAVVRLLINGAPSACFHSPERVVAWVAHGGLLYLAADSPAVPA